MYSFGDPLCGRVALGQDQQRPQAELQPAPFRLRIDSILGVSRHARCALCLGSSPPSPACLLSRPLLLR